MARIAVVSDVHLGTRQYGLKERYEDFLTAFTRFGASVAETKPDFVVIGGDLFDSPRPDANSVKVAQETVRLIKQNGINVYGIDGNHDLADGNWLDVIGAYGLFDTPLELFGLKMVGINYRNGRDLIEAIRKSRIEE